jgi:hypothetical protein
MLRQYTKLYIPARDKHSSLLVNYGEKRYYRIFPDLIQSNRLFEAEYLIQKPFNSKLRDEGGNPGAFTVKYLRP